jgi:hypothetical protein
MEQIWKYFVVKKKHNIYGTTNISTIQFEMCC